MKELSIEEKAKAYDKAIDRAKELLEIGLKDTRDKRVVLSFFPELKEPEDEEVRKALIDYFDDANKADENPLQSYGIYTDKAIAWLEKQGQVKESAISQHENLTCKENDNSLTRCKSALEAINEEKVENVDKVVPKFDVDDWIVCNETLVKIVDCDNNRYTVETTEGLRWSALIGTVDREFHKWTIADAKAGDVLTTVGNEYSFIYKGCLDPKHPNSPVAYCGLDLKGELCVNSRKSNHWWTDTTVHPATKAQRDLLFSKMHEAGYVWDETRLKLKKIKSDNEL